MQHTSLSPIHEYIYDCTMTMKKRDFFSLCSYEEWRKNKGISCYEQDDGMYDGGAKWLFHSLLHVEPFTDEVYETILRLHGGRMSPQDWGAQFSTSSQSGRVIEIIPFETVQWLLNKGVVIDWNTSRAHIPPLYSVLFTNKDDSRSISYASLLLQDGACPNLFYGHEPLLTYCVRHLPRHVSDEMLLQEMECLLQGGADPMLTNPCGETVVDAVRNSRDMEKTFQNALVSLLERYA